MPDPYREPIKESPSAAPLPESAFVEKKEAVLPPEKEKPAEQAVPAEQPTAPSVAAPVASSAGQIPAVAVAEDVQNLLSYEKNQQLKALVDLAFTKGVNHAADVARQLDSPYLMDEFHDTLIDQLHKELVARGKLEEI